MAELSVGYTAGLIALGIFIAQIWVPTAISFLLAGFLRDEETAASWSVAAKVLQSSHWTTILRTDSVRTHAVRRPISLASIAIPSATILTAVASVVTPLGLYEDFVSGGWEECNFAYVRDASAYFYGTSPRRNHSFSRLCWFAGRFIDNPGPCPFTNDTLIFTGTKTGESWDYPNNITMDIPPILREVYSSGTEGFETTISNFFDIEWRQLTTYKDDTHGILNHGAPYTVNMYRQLDSIALDNSVKLIEGLVVDTRSGGIGFRNHTVPQPPDRNVTWKEDLLFIEPVTNCVDTNLTYDFTQLRDNYSSYDTSNYRLTDRGGFVHLNHTYPYYDVSNPQRDPDLWGRAYKAALLNNFYTMVFLNVSNPADKKTGTKSFEYLNSTVGKSFPLPLNILVGYNAASLTYKYGDDLFPFDSTKGSKYPNPFNVTQRDWFDTIPLICSGAGPADTANVTNIFVTCGLVKGPPRRVDGGPQGIFEQGSKWTMPLYSCATAVRATIKTVHFSTDKGSDPATQFQTNQGLLSFRVTNITAKHYPNPEAYPLWGVEDTGRSLRELTPLWGLVSPAYRAAQFPNISFVQQPSLYLVGLGNHIRYKPTLPKLSISFGNRQNLPGAEFPFAVANTLYDVSEGISDSSWPFDLIGRADMAVFTRWQTLTATPEGTAKMVNLLWTDLAASAVVGTKGIATGTSPSSSFPDGRGAGAGGGGGAFHVRPAIRRTRYHSAYGIPAFVLLVALVLLTTGALVASCTRLSTIEKLRVRLQQLSAGRIFTIVLYPGESDFRMPPKQWSRVSGSKTVKFADGMGGPESGGAVEESANLVRDVHTPGGYTVSEVGTDSKVEFAEEMGPVHHDGYSGGQHGGYIALGPVSYGGR
ncbi:hypothetical protein C7999DRAFT_36207 [Corynascus novoguineensis]|uniref:Uncharacterized protein n=1 Tax=Corynascus novoguineensis TaxID=1126955 RepID=A0AAN7CK03_9PEZI|nr:hypothetical protein C7999DRAFT_36207 [Corynascus novoguineensis]